MSAVREVCGQLSEWQRQRHAGITIPSVRFLFGLSAVSTGLDQIERGKVDDGAKCARHGLEFLRKAADEAGESR